ncbi:unnamed protein product [Heterobilharzia americana]|nr:unnamed protein product [Heterobilharzia americana]
MKYILKNKLENEFIKTKQDLITILSKWPPKILKILELHIKSGHFKGIQKVFNLCANNKNIIPIPIESNDFILINQIFV